MKNCRECSKEFEPIRSSQLFCSKLCTNRWSRNNLAKTCKCGTKISRYSLQCSNCFNKNKKNFYIEEWLSGNLIGGTDRRIAEPIRQYLLDMVDYKCSRCGFDERHPDDNSCILEIDHIDGNGSNHHINNLRVLCPNCHALTSTYRGRNRGNGRKVFYTRATKN